jgi:hypothetical protein
VSIATHRDLTICASLACVYRLLAPAFFSICRAITSCWIWLVPS